MTGFQEVFDGYITTAKLNDGKVPNKNITPALQAIREDIPEKIRNWIRGSGMDLDQYEVRGSCGEINFRFAHIPWIGIFNKNITRSAQRGYFVVLLFSNDMTSLWLSLNQGYKQFEKYFKSNAIAARQIQNCAKLISGKVEMPEFQKGPIDLKALNALGKGYQLGAILSKKHNSIGFDESRLQADVIKLIKVYENLYNSDLHSVIDQLTSLDEADFQEVVSELAVSSEDSDEDDDPVKPIPSPSKTMAVSKMVYQRKPRIAAQALKRANFRCEGAAEGESHDFFLSRVTRKNYVEAHHFIPFSRQKDFSYSLDVKENIAALCPVCHRKLHHASVGEKTKLLKKLLEKKAPGLALRGLDIDLEQLKTYYSYLGDED